MHNINKHYTNISISKYVSYISHIYICIIYIYVYSIHDPVDQPCTNWSVATKSHQIQEPELEDQLKRQCAPWYFNSEFTPENRPFNPKNERLSSLPTSNHHGGFKGAMSQLNFGVYITIMKNPYRKHPWRRWFCVCHVRTSRSQFKTTWVPHPLKTLVETQSTKVCCLLVENVAQFIPRMKYC